MILICYVVLTFINGTVGIGPITGKVVQNDQENSRYLMDFEKGLKAAGATRRDNPEIQWVSSDQCFKPD